MRKDNDDDKITRTIILMILVMLLFALADVLFYFLYEKYDNDAFYSVFVTLLTISYHFIMRLAVGEIVTLIYAKKEFILNTI